MFWHIYLYRIRCFLHEKEELFWSLLFPIILCLCFVVGFSGINEKAYTFHTIPTAIVYEQENSIFRSTMDIIAKADSQGEPFLKVTETDYDTAADLLSDKKVDGIILVKKDDISLIVGNSGINQTALQSFINQYLQRSAMFETIAETNPEIIPELAEDMSESVSFIKEETFTKDRMDPMASYYFSLIAFAALCGGFLALRCARQLKADATPEGIRKSVSPVGRGLLLTAEFLATYTVHLVMMLILILVMVFIYRIDLGHQMGYVALTAAVGSLSSIAIGLFIGSLPKLKEAMQTTIIVVYSLLSSFLAGLMVADMKIIIQKNVPVISRINPATLIQDALYSLTIYDTHERFFMNIISLVVISVIFLAASIFMTRRKSYASI
ncbi:MAG: ABC transporter permease [Butyrivibrio sp.]